MRKPGLSIFILVTLSGFFAFLAFSPILIIPKDAEIGGILYIFLNLFLVVPMWLVDCWCYFLFARKFGLFQLPKLKVFLVSGLIIALSLPTVWMPVGVTIFQVQRHLDRQQFMITTRLDNEYIDGNGQYHYKLDIINHSTNTFFQVPTRIALMLKGQTYIWQGLAKSPGQKLNIIPGDNLITDSIPLSAPYSGNEAITSDRDVYLGVDFQLSDGQYTNVFRNDSKIAHWKEILSHPL